MAEPAPLVPPDSIEGFRVGPVVRESGVLLVCQGTSKLDLPVEILLLRADATTGGFDADDFLAAVRRASSVQHESLLPFLTGGRHDGLLFAVAKMAEGVPLGDLVAKEGPLDEARTLRVLAAALRALAALERAGMRHGDLAPQRVHRAGDRHWLLGCPRILPAALAPRSERWQAPEEARGGENGVQSDLFVCGLLAAWAMTGKHPVGDGGDARRVLRDWPAPDAAALLPRASAATRALVAKLLAPEPSGRFISAADALRAAEEAAAPPPETAPIPLAPPPVMRPLPEPPKRPPARLYVDSRLGESLLEIEGDAVHLGPGSSGTVRAEDAAFPGAVLRIERTPASDFAQALSGELRVNDAAGAARRQLADGDRLECGGVVARYERAPARNASRAATSERPQPKNPLAAAIAVVAILGTLGAVAWGALRAQAISREPADARALASRAKRALEDETPKDAPPPAPKETGETAESAARDAYEAAARIARVRRSEARTRYYEVWQRYPDTAYGLLARLDALEIERASRGPADTALEALLTAGDVPDGVAGEETVSRLRTLAEDKAGTLAGERAKLALMRLSAVQRGRYDADMEAVRTAIGKRDWRAALDILRQVESYAPQDLRAAALAEKDRVLAGMNETQKGSATPRDPPPPPRRDDGAAPPQPPARDPEAERSRVAEELLKSSRRLMDSKKDADAPQALDGFLTLLRDHKAVPAVAKAESEIRGRVRSLAAGPAGIVRLFRGKAERMPQNRWKIAYDFADAAQLEDWKDVRAFERPPRASWKVEAGAVRAMRGSGALVLEAVFRPDEVALSSTVTPDKPHDIGVMLVDPTEDRRFYLFTIQNTFFTLGRGADAKPFLENAIVLFGPNMWRDTPPNQLGFVRKCGSDAPTVRPNEPTPIRAGKSSSEVWMRFEGGRQIRGSAYGDKPYDFPGVKPALFVIDSNGFFDDVVIEGTPDPDWVRKRWDAILEKL